MKKQITFILILMTVSTTALICFQFYWSFQSYQSGLKRFKIEVNDALREAVNEEAELRRIGIVGQYEEWLRDTSNIITELEYHPESNRTKFTIKEKFPEPAKKEDRFGMSFEYLDGETSFYKYESFSPEAKEFYIKKFAQQIILKDLRACAVTYYTQRLGKKLYEVFLASKVNMQVLDSLYKKKLEARNVLTEYEIFQLSSPDSTDREFAWLTTGYTTAVCARDELHYTPVRTTNIDQEAEQNSDYVKAGFNDPMFVMLVKMKAVLLSSVLLTSIMLFCFVYTVRTMLHHTKLTELKNDFVNNMTHELRTPIATIMVAIEAIRNFNLNPATTSDYQIIIHQQASRISLLVDKILKNLAIEQNQLEMHKTKLDLGKLVEEMIFQFRPQLELTNARLEFNYPELPIIIEGDKTHLSNVIATILDNAVKYSQDKVYISVNISCLNGFAQLEIKDTGIGIPSEYQEKVFEKFFRIPTGNLQNTKGYGLGLSYARSIIERHEGQISLCSKENTGTSFTIILPKATHETAQNIIA